MKNITKIEQKILFLFAFWSHFYGVSLAKANLHNKYMQKDDLNATYFKTKTVI